MFQCWQALSSDGIFMLLLLLVLESGLRSLHKHHTWLVVWLLVTCPMSAGWLPGHLGHLGDGGDREESDRREGNIGGFQQQIFIPSPVKGDILDRRGLNFQL